MDEELDRVGCKGWKNKMGRMRGSEGGRGREKLQEKHNTILPFFTLGINFSNSTNKKKKIYKYI